MGRVAMLLGFRRATPKAERASSFGFFGLLPVESGEVFVFCSWKSYVLSCFFEFSKFFLKLLQEIRHEKQKKQIFGGRKKATSDGVATHVHSTTSPKSTANNFPIDVHVFFVAS